MEGKIGTDLSSLQLSSSSKSFEKLVANLIMNCQPANDSEYSSHRVLGLYIDKLTFCLEVQSNSSHKVFFLLEGELWQSQVVFVAGHSYIGKLVSIEDG